MMEPAAIFSERLRTAWGNGSRYVRLISGSSGTPVLLLLAVILFTYGYNSFLTWLPDAFPTQWLMTFVLALILTKCTVRTFLQEADVLFLLPLEHRMTPYFRYSLRYSAALQVIASVLLMSVFFPLYRVNVGSSASFAIVLAFTALFKTWNVYAYFRELQLPQGRRRHVLFRTAVNLLLAGLLFYPGSRTLYIFIAAVMLSVLTLYYSQLGKDGRYAWHRLLALEQKRRNALLVLAAFFIDVPYIKPQVKKRPLLSLLLHLLPYGRRYSTLHLFTRTFARSGEHLGAYGRLLFVTALFMLFVPSPYAAVLVYVIGLASSGMQLPSAFTKHRDSLWMKLYPLSRRAQDTALVRLVCVLLLVKSFALSCIYAFVHHAPAFTVGLFGIGVLFSIGFSFLYLPRRVRE